MNIFNSRTEYILSKKKKTSVFGEKVTNHTKCLVMYQNHTICVILYK